MIKRSIKNNDWIKISEWETQQPDWMPTLESLKYHKNELEKTHGKIELKLLCGADLLESFNVPGLWRDEHVKEIISSYGLAIINRVGSNPETFIYENDLLYKNKVNFILQKYLGNKIFFYLF